MGLVNGSATVSEREDPWGVNGDLGDDSFRLLSPEEMKAESKFEWLVDGILPVGGLSLLAGKEGTYKTFLALDLALSIAGGYYWHGREVKQGPVLYVSAEGRSGMRNRIAAWEQSIGEVAPADCHFLARAVQFHQADMREVLKLLARIENQMEAQPALLVVDTLSRCFVGGDENEARDMSLFINGLDQVRRRTGTGVLIIHHFGKGATQVPRGSSALQAAMDTIMLVSRTEKSETSSIKVWCDKQKDGKRFEPMSFRPRVIPLGGSESSLVLSSEHSLTNLDRSILKTLSRHDALGIKDLKASMTNDKYPTGPALNSLRDRLTKVLVPNGFVTFERVKKSGQHIYRWTGKRWPETW